MQDRLDMCVHSDVGLPRKDATMAMTGVMSVYIGLRSRS
jgi:hypothetical protein